MRPLVDSAQHIIIIVKKIIILVDFDLVFLQPTADNDLRKKQHIYKDLVTRIQPQSNHQL